MTIKHPPGSPSRDELQQLAFSPTIDGPGPTPGTPPLTGHRGAPDAAVVSVGRPDPSDIMPARIGRYVILQRLGEGGMGVVFSAYDPELDRKVALKLVRNSQQHGSVGRARVLREAQAMAQLSHSHVVHVYEVGQDDRQPDGPVFIAMEFVAGVSLAEWQRRNLPQGAAVSATAIRRCLRLYLQAASGLFAAHQLGIVHRDFKPDNVLVGDDGNVRVADFGLARPLASPGAGPLASAGSAPAGLPSFPVAAADGSPGVLGMRATPRLTQIGTILGTPGYMSPEQVRGQESDARSDQFSFCVALYEALYQQLPFASDTFEDFALNVLAGKQRSRPSVYPDLPIAVEQAVQRGLSIEPAARFPSMQELSTAMEAALGPESETFATRAGGHRFGVAAYLLVTLALISARILGLGTAGERLEPAIAIAAAMVVATGILSVVFRHRLRAQLRYRRLRFLYTVVNTYMLVGRLVAYSAGLSRSQSTSLEMVGLGAILLMASQQADRRLGWVGVASGLAGVLMRLLPAARPYIVSVYFPLLALTMLALALRGRPAEDP